MEVVEWLNEDEVDTASLHIPANKQTWCRLSTRRTLTFIQALSKPDV